ncbi:MAG: MFS transporter [Alphaproteobacteria bacterium]|nr:MAG: MFS transporter [Alphaproteobacteria bacterium]
MTDTRHPFAFASYRFFWTARLLAMLAHSATVVSLGWYVYDLARQTMDVRDSAFLLGLIGLVQFLPVMLLSPLAGYAADRFDRRNVVRLTLLGQFLCSGIITFLVLTGRETLTALFVLAGLLAAVRTFYRPTMDALAARVVPANVLPSAIALNSIAGRIGAIVGPAVGGFAFAVSAWAAFALASGMLLIALACQFGIGPIRRLGLKPNDTPIRMMVEGFRYVLGNRLLLGAISLDLFSVLLGGVTAMLPVFARDILHTGPEGLGLLRTAPSVGAVLMALWLSWKPVKHAVGAKMLVSVIIFGIGTIAFGLSKSMPFSLFCLFVLGAADMISVYVRQSLVLITTPDKMRGRVGSVSTLFISASNELGEMESGTLAALIGPIGSVVVGGVSAVVIAVAWIRLFPELWRAHDFASLQAPDEP